MISDISDIISASYQELCPARAEFLIWYWYDFLIRWEFHRIMRILNLKFKLIFFKIQNWLQNFKFPERRIRCKIDEIVTFHWGGQGGSDAKIRYHIRRLPDMIPDTDTPSWYAYLIIRLIPDMILILIYQISYQYHIRKPKRGGSWYLIRSWSSGNSCDL